MDSKYVNSIFEQIWWLEMIAPGKKWREVIIQEDNRVLARWVTVEGNKLVMPILTQTLGYWIDPAILHEDRFYNKQKEIINQLIAQQSLKSMVVNLAPENTYFLPFVWKHFEVTPRISYRINDLSDLDKVYNSFGKIVKKNIKTARNKVMVQEIDDITLLYTLCDKTFKIQSRRYPLSIKIFERLYTICKQHNACKLLYAIDTNGNVHSGAFFVYDKNICYYLIAGTDPVFRSSGANSLLLWEGIQYASRVSDCFDFEGSMIEGIEHFIKQFGGTPVVYYSVHKYGLFHDILRVLKPRVKSLLGYK